MVNFKIYSQKSAISKKSLTLTIFIVLDLDGRSRDKNQEAKIRSRRESAFTSIIILF